MFYFHPYWGKWSNLTNIFEMGWNHQLVLGGCNNHCVFLVGDCFFTDSIPWDSSPLGNMLLLFFPAIQKKILAHTSILLWIFLDLLTPFQKISVGSRTNRWFQGDVSGIPTENRNTDSNPKDVRLKTDLSQKAIPPVVFVCLVILYGLDAIILSSACLFHHLIFCQSI